MKKVSVSELKVGDIIFDRTLNTLEKVSNIYIWNNTENKPMISLNLGFVDEQSGKKRFYTKTYIPEQVVLIP